MATIRRHLSLQHKAFFRYQGSVPIMAHSHSLHFSSYLALNPSIQPQKSVITSPAAQRTLNRLRLDTESCCYQHSHQNSCAYCDALFSPHHYLLECPVTSSSIYLEQLLIPEHDLPLEDQAIMVLKRLSSSPIGASWINLMEKHPIRVSCSFPEHGIIPQSSKSAKRPLGILQSGSIPATTTCWLPSIGSHWSYHSIFPQHTCGLYTLAYLQCTYYFFSSSLISSRALSILI